LGYGKSHCQIITELALEVRIELISMSFSL
jgi:hypothetical protein